LRATSLWKSLRHVSANEMLKRVVRGRLQLDLIRSDVRACGSIGGLYDGNGNLGDHIDELQLSGEVQSQFIRCPKPFIGWLTEIGRTENLFERPHLHSPCSLVGGSSPAPQNADFLHWNHFFPVEQGEVGYDPLRDRDGLRIFPFWRSCLFDSQFQVVGRGALQAADTFGAVHLLHGVYPYWAVLEAPAAIVAVMFGQPDSEEGEPIENRENRSQRA